jgi:signal transduction histidine kinase
MITLQTKISAISLVLRDWRNGRSKRATTGRDSHLDTMTTISHEMRNSLTVMRNAAALLRSSTVPPMADRACTLIERHVAHMNRFVDDLMAAAAEPNGSQKTLQRAPIDLRTVIQHAIESIAPDMEQRGHRLVVQLTAAAVWVHADAARLEQAFSNVLINAAKYTPDGGDIAVTLDSHGTRARLRIRDSGIGIDAAMLLKVFDLYARAAPVSLADTGSGIGLTLARELVEKHGGTVQAASAGLGLGSEFTIIVPVLWAIGPADQGAGAN